MTKVSTYSRSILGRGCDPVRAQFAKKMWEPQLNVEIDSATSDQELIDRLTSGKRYEVFFIAPGQCSLIRSGYIDGNKMIALVKKHQPWIKVIMIDDVTNAISMLSSALELETPKVALEPLTEAWPFVD